MFSLTKLKRAIKKRINYEKRVVVGQSGFIVPVQSGRAVHASDPWMQTVLAELFADFPGTFIDVGVNLGQTLICAKAIDPDRPYVGFEPNLTCVSYAQEFVRLNGIRNVVLIPAALADRSGIADLNFISASETDSCASIVPDFRPGRTIATQKVLMIGRDLAQTIIASKVGVIKIDVEGAEVLVLQALEDIIARDRPAIVIEILPAYAPENTARIETNTKVEDFCRRHGYALTRVTKGPRTGREEIAEIGIHDDLKRCDYVLLPRT